jgi:hypothetical protein
MANWQNHIQPDTMEWLLEEDPVNPSIRYFAFKDLMDLSDEDHDLMDAQSELMRTGPVATILSHMQPEGYWERSDVLYYPKYTGTVWQIILLAQLGADGSHPQVKKACDYLMDHAIGKFGGFSAGNTEAGAIHCLQGNLCKALLDLGFQGDPRLMGAVEWMACSITGSPFHAGGETKEIRYLRSGISGPGFLCSANDHQPCAWGATKAALALAAVPEKLRTPIVREAIQSALKFLLSCDPATAEYPHPYAPKPSGSWFKFGFPVFYVTDLLQVLEALLAMGVGQDPRLASAIVWLLENRDEASRWRLTYTYHGKTWTDIEEKHQPSKWVTLRALRVLKGYFS